MQLTSSMTANEIYAAIKISDKVLININNDLTIVTIASVTKNGSLSMPFVTFQETVGLFDVDKIVAI